MCRDAGLLGSGSGSVRGAPVASVAAPLPRATRWQQLLGGGDGGVLLDEGQHETCVDSWLERVAKDLPPPQVWRLFTEAFGVLWARTETTLGEVTLTAIAERVLHNAAGKFPFLSALRGEEKGRIHFRALDERARSVDGVELGRGIRFVLTELLTVLGNLTAEILTPELHAALSNVALPEPVHGEGKATGGAIDETDGKTQGKGS